MSARCLISLGFSMFVLSSASAQEEPARAVWGRFETPAEAAAWKTNDTTFEPSEKFVTEGAHSARLHFHKYTGARGAQEWPSVSAHAAQNLFPTDWSAWGALALDISNGSSESERIAIEIRDKANKNGWVSSYIVPPNGTATGRGAAAGNVGRRRGGGRSSPEGDP